MAGAGAAFDGGGGQTVDAEAMARRQEIAAATDRINALSDQFDAALDAKRRQIEDAEAIAHAGAIAATDGLDAVFIGPVDLTFDGDTIYTISHSPDKKSWNSTDFDKRVR